MCRLCRVVVINKLICVMVKIYLSCHVCYTLCSISGHKRKLYILLICGSFVATSDQGKIVYHHCSSTNSVTAAVIPLHLV